MFQTPFCSLMLHFIPHYDPQPDLHDHPCSFLSIILRGGYTEVTPKGVRVWPRWSIHLMRATDRHRIVETSPDTLTLVFAGPVVRPWGFHTTGGWVPWREYEHRRLVLVDEDRLRAFQEILDRPAEIKPRLHELLHSQSPWEE